VTSLSVISGRRAKLLAYGLGSLLFVGSLVFLAAYTARNWTAVGQLHISSPAWLVVSVALYAVSHPTTGLAWPLALRQLGEPVPILVGLRIGLTAQVGKYLPGSIAHYVGRGGLARVAGIPLRASGLSTALELTSCLAGGLIILVAMVLIDPRPVASMPILDFMAIAIALALLTAAAALAAWVWSRSRNPLVFVAPATCLAASFALSGLSCFSLLAALDQGHASVAAVVGAFTLAWIAGFLVPGAPAGVGIREAVLLAALTPMVGAGPAIACTILHRLMTACVDAVAALLGYTWLASASLSKK
jgi:glycosyltransferase 2 family protein